MDMDSFVVRVYRRIFHGAEARETIVGVVENAAGTERHKFQGIEELWAILSGRPAASKPPRTDDDGPHEV